MEKIFDWLLYSSKNPEVISRSVTSFLMLAAPIAMHFTGLSEFDYVKLVSDIVVVISLGTTLFFLILKILNTIFSTKL